MKELREMLNGAYDLEFPFGDSFFLTDSSTPEIPKDAGLLEGVKQHGIRLQKSESFVNGKKTLGYDVSISDGKNSLRGSYNQRKDSFDLDINGLKTEMPKQEFESRLKRYQNEGFVVFEK